MHADSRARRFLPTMARHLALWLLFALAAGPLFPGAARAQFGDDGFAGPETEDAGWGAAGFGRFRFNDRYTTPFGPAYADIWLHPQNFLACKPPLRRPFTYALCLYSGPAVGTPVAAKGSTAVNPPLPCKLARGRQVRRLHLLCADDRRISALRSVLRRHQRHPQPRSLRTNRRRLRSRRRKLQPARAAARLQLVERRTGLPRRQCRPGDSGHRSDLGLLDGQNQRLRHRVVVELDLVHDRQIRRMHDRTMPSYRQTRQRRQRAGAVSMPGL